MSRRNLKKRVRLNPSDDIIISIKAKVIVKVCRAIWKVFTRKKRKRLNEEIERERLKRIADQHRISNTIWSKW